MTEPRDDAPDGLPDTTEPAAPEPEPAAPEPDTELADDIDAASGDEAIEFDDDVATEVLAAGAAAAAPAPTIPAIPDARRRGVAQPAVAAVPEPAIRIKDRASSLFVIITVAAFVLIFLNALLLGNGGIFNPYVPPTEPPTPSIVESPSASGSAAPSGSASPSGSVAPSGSAAPSPSVAPSVSPSPS
jgi:hypothetical protein